MGVMKSDDRSPAGQRQPLPEPGLPVDQPAIAADAQRSQELVQTFSTGFGAAPAEPASGDVESVASAGTDVEQPGNSSPEQIDAGAAGKLEI